MQKNTLKFVLYKSVKPDSNNCYPIYLKLTVTHNGKTDRSYRSTGYKVKESEWHAGLESVVRRQDAKTINAALGAKFRAELSRIADLERKGEIITHKVFKETTQKSFYAYYREVTGSPQQTKNNITRISNYLYGDKTPYRCKKNQVSRPLKEPRFSDISIEWLRGFENFLRDIHSYKEGSIVTALADLQAMLNHAEREGLIDKCPISPKGFRKPPKEETDPVYLTKKERQLFLDLLFSCELSPAQRKALAYFMLGCYSGLRWSDWKRFSPKGNILPTAEGDMLVLRAQKNKNLVTMPVGPTLQKILTIIESVGPLTITYAVMQWHLKKIAKRLGIDKPIKTHVARHSAGLLFAELDLPREVAAHYLGVSMEVIDVYYHLTGKHIMARSAVLRAV